jgi:glycosyltransferase involved in cell wall biosynthesis
MRRVIWPMRVLIAISLGVPVRIIRRLLRRPPRIWQGFMPLHSLTASVKADRLAGFPSQSVVKQPYQSRTYALTTGADFDVVIAFDGGETHDQHWKCLCHLLRHGDIWVTLHQPFFPDRHKRRNDFVFRLLRLAGIRIIVFPYGADVAWRDRCRDRYDWVGRMQEDYKDWDLVQWGEITRTRVGLFSKYADFVIGMDGSLVRFLKRNDLCFKSFPVDTDRLKPADLPRNPVPLIVHATNHRRVKGTDVLIGAMKRLKALGIECELKIVENVDRDTAFEIYRRADIIADQFVIGAYGVFALEALALSKPTLTYLDHDHLENPVFNLPIVNTTQENMVEVLAALVQTPALRQRLGAEARRQVVAYQSQEAMAEVWKHLYEHVWWRKPLHLESTRHFSPDRKARSFSENPSDADFWPVPVDDLMPEIRRVLERLGSSSTHETYASDVA